MSVNDQNKFSQDIATEFNRKIPIEKDGTVPLNKAFIRKYMNVFLDSLDKMANITMLCQYEDRTVVSGPMFVGPHTGKETLFEYHGFDESCSRIPQNRFLPIGKGRETGGFNFKIHLLTSKCCKVRDFYNHYVKDKSKPGCLIRGAYERVTISFAKEF